MDTLNHIAAHLLRDGPLSPRGLRDLVKSCARLRRCLDHAVDRIRRMKDMEGYRKRTPPARLIPPGTRRGRAASRTA